MKLLMKKLLHKFQKLDLISLNEKTLKISLKNSKLFNKDENLKKDSLDQIAFLAENDLSPAEIESFLNISLLDFNQEFFTKAYKQYSNLLGYLNTIQLISYINFNEKFKKELFSSLSKKIIYPIFLIGFAFTTLVIFKFSILPLLESFGQSRAMIFINIFYYLSIIVTIIIVLIIILSIYVFKNPTYSIIVYFRLYNFRIFKVIESYYLTILAHLLISFDNQGLSTYQTFKLINKFKGSTIVSNLAYFVSSDLEEGAGLENSINNMKINDSFKNILILGIKSNKYNKLLLQYSKKLVYDIEREILYIARVLLVFAYVYIGIIVLVLYKILSLPLSLINQI